MSALMAWLRAAALVAVIALAAAVPAWGEPAEPAPDATVADVEALLARLWRVSGLAPARPVPLRVAGGLSLNAVSASGGITLSREFLRWAQRFPGAERERILARTLAHELAHLALGHSFVASPADELEAEALGIHYFELAGFDCRWWVDYVGAAAETAGRHGWPPLRDVVEHDRQACGRVRALLGRDALEGPNGIVHR